MSARLTRRVSRAVALVSSAALVTAVALFAVATASGGKPGAALQTYTVPGIYSWTVPSGLKKVTFTVSGAQGGDNGGLGGRQTASFAVTPGQVFEIVVGGKGGNTLPGPTGGAGGFNGGSSANLGGSGGGGGGGASDVRIGGVSNQCAQRAQPNCALHDRIVVGGGGGGGPDATGGGGAIAGFPGAEATQEGGASFGIGAGLAAGGNVIGGGGGGGWWGGRVVLDLSGPPPFVGQAGGGSGYVSSLALTSSFAVGVQSGDGSVVISG